MELRQRGRRPAQALLATIAGLSPLWAEELVVRSGLEDTLNIKSATQTELRPLWREVGTLRESLWRAEFKPTVYLEPEGRAVSVAPLPLVRYARLSVKSFPTMSAALDYYFQAKEREVQFSALQQSLLTKLRHQIERVEKKLALHFEAIQNAKKADRYRKFGELLLAYAYQLTSAGLTEVQLPDWTEAGTQVVVPLDPALTPVENAQRYFARYNNCLLYTSRSVLLNKSEQSV